jgi:anti-sigma B factor antagonist
VSGVWAGDCVRQWHVGRQTVLELRGEIDVLNSPVVIARLDALTRTEDPPQLVVDLRQVTFIDCAGLAGLGRAGRRMNEQRRVLHLVVEDPRVLRTLRVTHLAPLFALHPRLSDALREAREQTVTAPVGDRAPKGPGGHVLPRLRRGSRHGERDDAP